MDLYSAIILGVVQGITEFLPISSSGHLVVVQKLIPGFTQPGILFDVIIHLGTLFAVVFYFRKRILAFRINDIIILAVGTIPAVAAGLLFNDYLEDSFAVGAVILSVQFLITAGLCFFTDTFKGEKEKISLRDAFIIGISQAIAILPAISRSGATIFTARVLGIDKNKSAEYSFLLSVPAIIGANVLQLLTHKERLRDSEILFYFVGFAVSGIVGYLSISFTLKTLLSTKFKWFGVYCVVLAILIFFFLK